MTFFQRILDYYMTSSEFFQFPKQRFWAAYYHVGTCGPGCFSFESTAHIHFSKLERVEECLPRLSLPNNLAQDYFLNIKDEEMLFSLIFAHWLGIPQERIDALRTSQSLVDPLNFIAKYLDKMYPIYYIKTDCGKKKAQRDGNCLITTDGRRYQIEESVIDCRNIATLPSSKETFYQRILRYYLSSWLYFDESVTVFWDIFEFEGICNPGNLHFESDFYRTVHGKKVSDGGYVLSLNDSIIKKYFEAIPDQRHLFFVIFAHWLDLPLELIEEIAAAPSSDDAKKRLLNYIRENTLVYFIQTPCGDQQAIKEGDRLITTGGEIYSID